MWRISILDLEAPNPKCYVCAAKPEVVLKIDTDVVTVKELRDDVLIKALNMVDPDVIIDGKGVIVISSEEGETEDNEGKLLKDLFIVDGCILKVDDFFQNYELSITVVHKSVERDGPRFEVIADMDSLKPVVEEKKDEEPQPSTSGTSNGSKSNGATAMDTDDDDEIECIDFVPGKLDQEGSSAEKRKHADDEESLPSKRARIQTEEPAEDDDDEIVCID